MKLLDYPAKIMNLIALVGMFTGAIWFFAENELRQTLRDLLQADNTVEGDIRVQGDMTVAGDVQPQQDSSAAMRAEIRQGFETMAVRMKTLEERLAAVEPQLDLVVFDRVRSRVLKPCPINGICEVSFRYRRTPEGEACNVTNVQRYIVDFQGHTFPVEIVDAAPVRNATTDWTVTNRKFVIPEAAVNGPAEMYMTFNYEKCGQTAPENDYYKQTSPRLIFTIDRRSDE